MNYKDTPIIILNRDRLIPIIKLVNILSIKGYNNIHIIDNYSTYPPLIEWYKHQNIASIFYNDIVPNTINTLSLLIGHKVDYFLKLISRFYVYTDSDTIPIDDIPDNFIEVMQKYIIKYKVDKIGLGIQIDDIMKLNPNPNHPLIQKGIQIESQYWNSLIKDELCTLYKAPIDTTFALCKPNGSSSWTKNALRLGYPYLIRHLPFYYDIDNLPEDELYYLKNINPASGANWSMQLKKAI